MKSFCMMIWFILAMVGAAFAAEAVAPVAAVPAVGFLDWFKQNSVVVFGAALALSELLALIPAFQGNGILDTIIKALKTMAVKPVA